MARLPGPEKKAECVLTMGQAMEQVGDYPVAVRYYREAMALEPTHTFTWYFINNNLGFSLNALGQFSEGELYCRKAIEIDRSRPNAHQNLGISLAGRGQSPDSARCFIAATQANAADARAFRLLEDLLKQHPELEFEFQGASECCQKAVEVAAKKAKELKPTIHSGGEENDPAVGEASQAFALRGWRGSSPAHAMIACLDVAYGEAVAHAAGITFRAWADASPLEERVVRVEEVHPYQPGRFFRHEVPCLLAVLRALPPAEVIVVDGYICLGGGDRPGPGRICIRRSAGERPWSALPRPGSKEPGTACEVVRGRSTRPHFFTAAGMSPGCAAEHVRSMHGPYRIPALLKRLDELCRRGNVSP